MTDLKDRAVCGGMAKVGAQAVTFALRIGSLMVLARLLEPRDFGLVSMVTALTGVLNLFRDFGLSTAAVQRTEVIEEQVSTLFWINLAVGVSLSLLLIACSPMIAKLYHEPRLIWIAMVLASGFLFNAAGVQHSALLQRQMRFSVMAGIDVLSLSISIAIAIVMAIEGFGYWSLVAMSITPPLINTIGFWVATAWIPGPPSRRAGVRSMVRFGGTITLNGLVVYIAYNLEKVLLGRFWGADAVGLYTRAYQLINIPTENLNTSVGEVAFSALSRTRDDPERLKRYFLKGYSLVLTFTIPMTLICAFFAGDIVLVLLGPKWTNSIVIFQLLAPTILIFAMINPLSWLLFSLGMVGRSLKVGLVLAPLVIVGYVAGLPFGPKGVALAYSTVTTIWALPHIAWCVHGTIVSFKDIVVVIGRPLLAGFTSALLVFGLHLIGGNLLPELARLLISIVVVLIGYFGILFYVMGQKEFYIGLARAVLSRSLQNVSPGQEKALVSI